LAESVFSEKKFFIYFQVWWVIAAVFQYFIIRQKAFDNFHILTDAISSNLILGMICYFLANNMRYYLPREEKYWYIIISSIIVCFIWLILIQLVFNIFFPDGDAYLQFYKSTYAIRFGAGFLLVSSINMFSLLLYNQQAQKEITARQSETEKLNREAELTKLRQQLQPHFLFNSLNSISSLTASSPEKARQMIQQLSEFLRGMLKKDDEKFISLKTEMQYLNLYLEIEKVRFGHRLQTEILYSQQEENALLPPMILQPIVENAIKYGLYDTLDEVLISIKGRLDDHQLIITVTNPYDPESGRGPRGTGFGLSSIRRRLFLLYSRKDLVQVSELENLFTTELRIPQL